MKRLGEIMGDMGDVFNEMRSRKKTKRADNTLQSTELLRNKGIVFLSKNGGAHLVIGEIDFWPSTGLWINRATKKKSRGVLPLLRELGGKNV